VRRKRDTTRDSQTVRRREKKSGPWRIRDPGERRASAFSISFRGGRERVFLYNCRKDEAIRQEKKRGGSFPADAFACKAKEKKGG